MSLAAGLAIAQGVKTLGSYAYNKYKNNQRKKFGDSSYGKELQRIGSEGRFSPTARNEIVGSANRASAGVAQSGKASYAGRIAAQGLEGSVAAQRGMNEYDIQRQRDIADTSSKVTLANEESKVDARLSYAEQKLADDRARQEAEQANTNQLISGLGDLAKQGISAYYGDLDTKRRIDAFKNVDDINKLRESVGRGDLSQQDFLTLIYFKRLEEEQQGGGGTEFSPYGSSNVVNGGGY